MSALSITGRTLRLIRQPMGSSASLTTTSGVSLLRTESADVIVTETGDAIATETS